MGRRDKRKEARLAKNQRKHQAWIEHQRSQKLKKTSRDVKSKHVNKLKGSLPRMESEENHSSEKLILSEKDEVKLNSSGKDKYASSKVIQGKKDLNKRARKTKFEEFLEMDRSYAGISAEEDLELERKLAKKLKVKNGKLKEEDDGILEFLKGVPSIFDLSKEEEVPNAEELPIKKKRKKQKLLDQELKGDLEVGGSELEEINGVDVAMEETCTEYPSHKKHRNRKSVEHGQEDKLVKETVGGVFNPVETHDMEVQLESPARVPASRSSVKYVAPHLRSHASKESEEHTQIRRRVRGLLNRLSESNVESITGGMSSICLSVGRSVGSQIVIEEVLASCSSGPRGNEQYAAVFAAFVAGMACMVGIDFSAKLMASLAKSFENEYFKEDNLSLRNLTLLLSYLCIFGVCSSELIYDFLVTLSRRLTEIDVSTILTILQCCGMKIRADDHAAMRDFILSVQNRVTELKASSGGQENINGKRMEFMLETILDIKNNKKRPKEDTVQHVRIKKWLQKLRVEDILIRGLKWDKLLDPNKKGQWWLSGDTAAKTENVEAVAITIDKEVLEAQKMLQLASAQRMNTDARRAIFCIIMSGEDYIDTFKKLLTLDLPAKQDREIIRVLVECCLQERVFNKYYTILASRLCEHDKNHKFTLQFCLWDHFKGLETMQLIRSMHLAKFVAEMVTSFTLSPSVLKSIDFSDPKLLTPKRIMHFRMLFEAIFDYPDNVIWNMFTRIAVTPELETLRSGIEFFLKEYVVKTNKTLATKFKIARKALNNAEGVLM